MIFRQSFRRRSHSASTAGKRHRPSEPLPCYRPLLDALEDRCVPTATLWTQRGGDAGHSSYVDVSFDPAALTEVWSQPLGYSQSGTGSWSERAVAIDEARVYRTALEGYAPSGTYHVIAYDLQSGSEEWHRTFVGNAFEGVGEPSVAGGIVYVNRAGHSGISGGTNADLPRIYGLDAATGNTVLERTYAAQWGSNERPVIAAGRLVVEDGYYGGISSYQASSLTRQWFVGRGAAYDPPFAALDDQYAYAFNTEVYRLTDGVRLPNIVHPAPYSSVSDPMVSSSGRVLFDVSYSEAGTARYGVAAYDGDTHALLWTANTPEFVRAKAVGNGLVAAAAGQDLFLFSEADGSLVGSWHAPAILSGEIVLTRSHVFVQSYGSSLATVHAVDLDTRQQVWSYQNNVFGGAIMEMAFGGDRLLLSHHLFVRAFGIESVNGEPTARNLSASTAEDTPLQAALPASDPNGDPLTYAIVAAPAHGNVSLNPTTGAITYTPAPNYYGPDGFTFRVSDGTFDSNTATVTLTVTPVNDLPTTSPLDLATDEDISVSGVLPAADIDGDTLSFSIVAAPQHGTLTSFDTATGAFTYRPAANYHGSDAFTFRVNDGLGNSAVATVSLTIRPVADAPVAYSWQLGTAEDTPLTDRLRASDADGDPLTFVIVTPPAQGTLNLNSTTGDFTYTPALNYNGTLTFTFRANDGLAVSNLATIWITVRGLNDPPVAQDASRTTNEDTPLSGQAVATDVDGSALTYAVLAEPLHGSLSFGTTGAYTYVPAADFHGSDSFTFRAFDGVAYSNVGTISIMVVSVNDPPVTQNASRTTNEDTPLSGQAVATDVEGAALTYAVAAEPQHGALSFGTNGVYTYVPAANYHGPDSFTFRAFDGAAYSNVATISIEVQPVNDPPTALDAYFSLQENAPIGTIPGGIQASDVDGDALTYELSGAEAAGFAMDPTTGVLRVADPAFLDFETDPTRDFQVLVRDGFGGQAVAAVRVALTDVLEVDIDILPADSTNQVNLGSSTIEVAILASATFDPVSMVDIGSLRLSVPGSSTGAFVPYHPKRGYQAEIRDVNGDGRLDLVLKFKSADTGIQQGDTALRLEGRLLPEYGGDFFSSEQAVTVVEGGGGKGNGKGKKSR